MIDIGDLMNMQYIPEAAKIEYKYLALTLDGKDHTATCNMTIDEAENLKSNCESIARTLRAYLNAQ